MTDGRRLGSAYVLEELIGSGAMGQVWRGRDAEGRAYAFKVLRSDFAEDPRVVERFIQERAILTGLRHPNLVGVHDLVAEGTTLAIVMDLVPGEDLRTLLRREGTLPPARAAELCAGVAAGLAAAHEAGIYHRDIKPENVLVDTSAEVPVARVVDFGIARLAQGDAPSARSTMMVGTPQYLSPETADGAAPGPAVDIYALGIVLYELCCGITPFASGSTYATIKQHIEHAPGRPEGIPDALWHLIDWLLAKDARERPPAARVKAELEGVIPLMRGLPAASTLEEPPTPTLLMATGSTLRDPTLHDQPTVSTPWPAQGATPEAAEEAPPRSARRRRVRALAAGAVAVVIVVAGAVWAVGSRDDEPGTAAAPGPSASQGRGSPSPPSSPSPTSTGSPEGPSDTLEPSTDAKPTTSAGAGTAGMPKLVGLSLSGVADMLPAGVLVEVRDVINPSEADGMVVAQDPAPGQPVPETVTVQVARQHITRYVADLSMVTNDDFQPGSYDANGQTFAHSIAAFMEYNDQSKSSYNLGRHYRRLVGTIGLSDTTEDPKARISFEVFADGRKIFDKTVSFGSTVELDLDVTNVLRLEVVNGKIALDGEGLAVWGDLHVLGVPGEVPEPSEGQ